MRCKTLSSEKSHSTLQESKDINLTSAFWPNPKVDIICLPEIPSFIQYHILLFLSLRCCVVLQYAWETFITFHQKIDCLSMTVHKAKFCPHTHTPFLIGVCACVCQSVSNGRISPIIYIETIICKMPWDPSPGKGLYVIQDNHH